MKQYDFADFILMSWFMTCMTLVFIGIVVAICTSKNDEVENNIIYYEYVDLDNKEGKAVECSYYFNESKSGGQGSPVCELEDETVLLVKQYTPVYEKDVIGY